MLRARVVGTVMLAVALLAAACGDTSTTGSVDEPATTTDSAAEPAPSTSAAPEEPAATTGAEASGAVTTSTEAPAESVDPDEAAAAGDGAGAVPADAGMLLASATTDLDGRSVRGEATIEFAPGLAFSTSFESDADGDLAAVIEVPPGMDLDFPAGAEAEMRYVDGVAYVRPPATEETLSELGVDEAWFVPGPIGDPLMAPMQSAGGVMCIFPQAIDEPFEDCDPLGDTATFVDAGREAEIVGREDVRGVETTRVRFLVSLLDLAGEAMGMEPEADDGEVGAFDDTASDPFAEGLDQIFGFLDADFEVEVWIDDESLIRRLSFDLASMFASLAGGDAGPEIPSSLINIEFYDYDADISVEAPPPDAIVEEDLLEGNDYYDDEDYDDDY